jgi:hypothetical protein
LGKGATSSYSRKLKLNIRSSTETELLTADMHMLETIWSLHLIQSQGYEAECVGLYQDNISTQLLIKNGKMSCGKKTKTNRSRSARSLRSAGRAAGRSQWVCINW